MNKLFILYFSLGLVGCANAGLLARVTPARVDRPALCYVGQSNDIHRSNHLFFSLHDANELKYDIDNTYTKNVFNLQNELEYEHILYSIHSGTVIRAQKEAISLQEDLVGETGILTIALAGAGLAGGGVLGNIMGRRKKRPTDITQEDHEAAIKEASNQV
jgi:hypothetical protein